MRGATDDHVLQALTAGLPTPVHSWEQHAMDEFRRLRILDPVGAKATTAAVRALADDPRPEGARALGASGY